jgi:PAS domain S-box-containing protein
MIDIDKLISYSKKLKLLYVEDNIDAREMTVMILEDFFDDIVVAVDGKDGYEKFQQNNFDLIMTDINMPILNGLEMVAKIRQTNSDIPVLILSAHNEDNFFINSIKLGIDGYILKPIDVDQLTLMIEKIVDKHIYKLEAKSNLNLLKSYQEAANRSSIVSKTDTKGIITYVNDAFCEISDYTREELLGKNHNIVRHPDNPKSIFEDMWNTIKDKKQIWRGLVRNRAKTGKSYYVDSLVMPILDLDGNIIEYISLRNDITNIMNPANQLSDAVKNSKDFILIYLKLDRFNDLEEFYDNTTIQNIQDESAKLLKKHFSKIYDFDTIYQLGSGEYALIIQKSNYLHNEGEFIKTLKTYQETIKEDKLNLENIDYDISVIISVVYEDEKALESAKLGIKKLLKNKQDFMVSNNLANIIQEKALQNMKTIRMIKDAIATSKILSYFQPIIDNKTQKVVKYESLVRLIDDNNKVLTPYFFLETAKKSDQYSQITNIVLEHSFTMLRNCELDISINLSALDIEQKNTRIKVLEFLELNKADASRVVFELLEDENVKDINVVKEFISDVKKYGVKIAIDDFGAGYSNYERLLNYQPDILKIDGCLIRDIETNNYSLSVVKSIVTFAKEQNLQTIAEFIENEAIFKIINDLGVDYSQGYYFGKPEPLI